MLRFRDAYDQPLEWVQVRRLARLYELISPQGVVARFDARGFVLARQASAETSEGRFRFEAVNGDTVVYKNDQVVARVPAAEGRIEFSEGAVYRFAGEYSILDADGQPVLHIERRALFPHWRVGVTLQPDAIRLPELPVLVCWICWVRARDLKSGSIL